jgi:hypothetical protein
LCQLQRSIYLQWRHHQCFPWLDLDLWWRKLNSFNGALAEWIHSFWPTHRAGERNPQRVKKTAACRPFECAIVKTIKGLYCEGPFISPGFVLACWRARFRLIYLDVKLASGVVGFVSVSC